MKKNITINLFGTLYNIDEDAYQLLDNYLQSMKNYFGRQQGGDEIADDIEHRVAELLWEHKEQGIQAINIETIKDIIGKIGNASEIDDRQSEQQQTNAYGEQAQNGQQSGTSGQTAGASFQNFAHEAGQGINKAFKKVGNHFSGRRLYRDSEDKLLGGVCSGISHYLGICDPVWIRLIFILLAIFSCSVWAIVYLILWIIIPFAQTPEDRLRMKGKTVNPDTLNEQVIRESEEQERATYEPSSSSHSGCLRFLFGCFLSLLLLPLILFLFIIFAFFVIFISSWGLFDEMPHFAGHIPMSDFFSSIASCYDGHIWFIWVGLLALIFAIYVPVYFIIRAIRRDDQPLSSTKIVWYILSWLLALAVTLYVGFYGWNNHKMAYNDDYHHARLEQVAPSLPDYRAGEL